MMRVAFGPSLLLLVTCSLIPDLDPGAPLSVEARGELEDALGQFSTELEETRSKYREKKAELAELRSLLRQLGDIERRSYFEMKLDASEAKLLEASEIIENAERGRQIFEDWLRETGSE